MMVRGQSGAHSLEFRLRNELQGHIQDKERGQHQRAIDPTSLCSMMRLRATVAVGPPQLTLMP